VKRDVLLVFMKPPRPGGVKTRLAVALGKEAAALLYRAIAEEVVERTRPREKDYTRLFFYFPSNARSEMEAWFPGETWVAQEGGDLGARMAFAFAEAFRRGAERVAIIGSDLPFVSRQVVGEALCLLRDSDLVVGPALDGGYYLLAMKEPRPSLFEGLAWSTPTVLQRTLERAEHLGLGVRLLNDLRDIDTLDDLRDQWSSLRPLLKPPSLIEAVDKALAVETTGVAIPDPPRGGRVLS